MSYNSTTDKYLTALGMTIETKTETFLYPEGRCVAYPVGVQLRLFPFIEFWVRKGILDFKNF